MDEKDQEVKMLREARVLKLLGGMLRSNRELYEKNMLADGFAYYSNELTKLAMQTDSEFTSFGAKKDG
jgi:hypothetical protein